MAHIATLTLAAQNTGTDWIDVRASRLVDVSISGGTGSTVHLQRSYDGGTTTLDVTAYSADVEEVSRNAAACKMRLFCKTGNYVDGATLRIAAGNKE